MRKRISFLVISSILIVLTLYFAHIFFSFTPSYPVYELDSGWTVTYHNQQYLNTNLESLSSQVGATFDRGDVITLTQTRPLPEMEGPFPYLFFKSQFCTYEIALDGSPIEEDIMTDLNYKNFIGIGYTFIPLPEDYAEKRISIKLFVTENETKADIMNPMAGTFDDLYRIMYNQAIYPFLTGCFLIVFGVVFLVISLLFYLSSSDLTTQILCSILTAILGVWMLTSYNTLDFIMSPDKSTVIEYCAMYLITPCIYLICYDLHKRFDNNILIILGSATFFFSLSFIALHFLEFTHITHFQKPYYLISFIGIIVLFFYDYMDIKSKTKNSSLRITMLGLTALCLSLVIYVLVALSRMVADYRQSRLLVLIIPTGALFFVITQLLNYFVFMTNTFAQKKEYAALTRIAYIDSLTGLSNRVSCDEKLAEFDKSEDNFCLVSLDLNGLKEVNDNSGHPVGDRLLKSFSQALSSVFSDVGTCTRIGGDEFMVLISSIDKDELDKRLKQLDDMLLKLDEEDVEINHSVSYGYAYRSETSEHNTHSVFMLADKRMYDYKRKFYSHMARR